MIGTPYNHLVQTLNKVLKAGVPKQYQRPEQYNLGLGNGSELTVEKTGIDGRPGYIVIYLKQTQTYFGPKQLYLLGHVAIGKDENAAFKKACAEASAYIQQFANYNR